MKNQTLNMRVITAFTVLMGMLFVLSDLVAQEDIRRGMRGGSLSEPDPGDSGGADKLTEERAEEGRPPRDPFSDNPGNEEPKGGDDPSEGPGGDDFGREEPKGGDDPSEGPGGDDPFMKEEPKGGDDPSEGPGGDDPFMG